MEEGHHIGILSVYHSSIAVIDITWLPGIAVILVGSIDQISILCDTHNFKLSWRSRVTGILREASLAVAALWTKEALVRDLGVSLLGLHAWRVGMIVVGANVWVVGRTEAAVQRGLGLEHILARWGRTTGAWVDRDSIEGDADNWISEAWAVAVKLVCLNLCVLKRINTANSIIKIALRLDTPLNNVSSRGLEGHLEIYIVDLRGSTGLSCFETMIREWISSNSNVGHAWVHSAGDAELSAPGTCISIQKCVHAFDRPSALVDGLTHSAKIVTWSLRGASLREFRGKLVALWEWSCQWDLVAEISLGSTLSSRAEVLWFHLASAWTSMKVG